MPTIHASTTTPSPAPVTPSGCRPTHCPRCGASFECGAALPASTPCGCAGIGLTPAQRASLVGRYEGCLCLPCLGAIARGEAVDAQEGAR
jgi:hypothetical protein